MMISSRLLEIDDSEPPEREVWAVKAISAKWAIKRAGIWTHVSCGQLAKFGWKVHVSATLDDAPTVLELVSRIAFDLECSFKHLSGVDSFLALHFKNASRLQSGKFIALYPENELVAARLLECLSDCLYPYQGLDILTDRAYKNSTNLFYRWGAFRSTGRLNSVGAPEELVPNGKGQMVPDIRYPRFLLPEGIVDPFSDEPLPIPLESPPESVSLDQFKVVSVLRFTNAGGRYKGVCQLSGAEVVVKEARPNTGFVGKESAIPRLHREVALIERINAEFQDLAPPVLQQFYVRDHYYVALQYLPGTPLSEWIARENPLYSCLYQSPERTREYFKRATRILESIQGALRNLHGLGLAFGDLSLGNIIIDAHDYARFIDFEACTSVDDVAIGLRTPDFCLLSPNREIAARDRDVYAYNCIAISLVLRLTTLAEISDHVLQAVTADLIKGMHEVPEWWFSACNYLTRTTQRESSCKATGFVPPLLDTASSRRELRQLIADAVLDSCIPKDECLFPTSATAREGAFLSFGFGSSGVLRALKLNGNQIDERIIAKFSESIWRAVERRSLPINYDVGIVGLIDACSSLGLDDLSARILEIVCRDWGAMTDPSLGTGLAGISLALRRQGDLALAEDVMTKAVRLAESYKWTKNGLLYGRSGVIAAACQFNPLLQSSDELEKVVLKIIREEIGQTVRHPNGHSLSLRGEVDGSRLLPYLCDGTAGLLLALLAASENEHIDYDLSSDDVVALSADLGTPFMLEGSLMDGAAGLAVVLELSRRTFQRVADRIPEPGWGRIQKYLLPLKSGVGVLHPRTLRFDMSHSQGSIGILEALLWVDGLAELNLSGLYLPPLRVN
ncbi:hypothetical protein ACQR0V_12190 [Bradyrhizobium sp. HKCCYLS2058]|uniref:class III lanthionine synthetase LanKC N-terminal domain-containing protein n=1 Tax=unclassified Bradyrhizobium TaxID=2631580 RepID=UPI003EB98233